RQEQHMLRGSRVPWALAVLVFSLLAPACERRTSGPSAIATHLIDLYKPEMVEGRFTGEAPTPPRTEWRFDAGADPKVKGAAEVPEASKKSAATRGWDAGPGVADLAIKDRR